ncbi:energy-coupling factor ABC transporter ATP-binding protein, partial [Bacteroides thetaiotaomicron]|uniref:hypothetical protein n=1 Tax=Bacteroides thetaiotaomicron TaxID=818 RepID=UPI001D063A69|nr:hypothetical protein [Bacteroides thetaiotaomicron]
RGQIVKNGAPVEVFRDTKWLIKHQLGLPKAANFASKLADRGVIFDKMPLDISDLVHQIVNVKDRRPSHE